MGVKVSTLSETSIRPCESTSSCCRRRRKVAMACFAMAVTGSTVEGFVPPSPCMVVTAHTSSTPATLFYNKRNNKKTTTARSYASSIATLGDATSTILPDTSTYNPDRHETLPNAQRRRLLPTKVRIRRRRKQQEQTALDYEERKQEWAATYTSVDALRETFGSNQNALWGDLDATTARRLYKTLLPRALMELYRLGVHPEDLAPLAYQARVAAKNYARERSIVPTRLMAMTYDGMRQWKRYGKFQVKGMTYDQVWNKYKQLIHEEEENLEDLDERDVTAKICLKILERSCETNAHVDRLFLRDFHHDPDELKEEDKDIDTLTGQLERDVRAILDEATSNNKAATKSPAAIKKHKAKALSAQQVFTLRMVARAKQRMERLGSHRLADQHHQDDEQEDDVGESALPPRHWKARVSKTHDRPKPWQHRTHPKRTQ